VRKRYLSLY